MDYRWIVVIIICLIAFSVKSFLILGIFALALFVISGMHNKIASVLDIIIYLILFIWCYFRILPYLLKGFSFIENRVGQH
jgi:hypothetical protein